MLGLSSQGIYSHGCVIVLFNTAAEYHTTNVLFVHMFRPLNELSHHCNLVHASMVFVSCCLVLKYSELGMCGLSLSNNTFLQLQVPDTPAAIVVHTQMSTHAQVSMTAGLV